MAHDTTNNMKDSTAIKSIHKINRMLEEFHSMYKKMYKNFSTPSKTSKKLDLDKNKIVS